MALAFGVGLGLRHSPFGASLEFLITPVLGCLLYGMFAQIPFLHLREAFANRRFTAALLTVNFIVIPVIVWLLSRLLPQHPPLCCSGCISSCSLLCIDYVIVFTHLGRGNARLVLASTPLLLLAQMLLLPAYLWLFMGSEAAQIMSADPFLEAFLVLIVLPLGLAVATEFWAKRWRSGAIWLEITAWLPVP
ncbi:MAG: arsenic resistance protein, partial [Nitrospiraceae bacterium]